MTKKVEKEKYGLPISVNTTMGILSVLVKKDNNEALNRFWKHTQSSTDYESRASMFLTLAMLDPERLFVWLKETPSSWWIRGTENKSIHDKFYNISGNVLQHLFVHAATVFFELLDKHKELFESPSCRYYLNDWCAYASPIQLGMLQQNLLSQPLSWFVTRPERVLFLNMEHYDAPMKKRAHEHILGAALAQHAVYHPSLNTDFPGIEGFVALLNGMVDTTKEKKKYLRTWMSEQANPELKVSWSLDINALDLEL